MPIAPESDRDDRAGEQRGVDEVLRSSSENISGRLVQVVDVLVVRRADDDDAAADASTSTSVS